MNESRAQTRFAPARRTPAAELEREMRLVAAHPATGTLLRAVGGVMAILDENRQILALNDAFLELLNVGDGASVLGLRPGEALDCIHAHTEPAGCGTALTCATCGALDAVLTAQRENRAVERECALKLRPAGRTRELMLRARACPFAAGAATFMLLFLQDTTRAHQLAALERTFLHDINNVLQGLQVTSEMAAVESEPTEVRSLNRHINRLVQHLTRVVELQRSLLGDDLGNLRRQPDQVSLARIQAELRRVFHIHPAVDDRHLVVARDAWNTWIRTDTWVLVRVLTNLVLNALEATPPGGRVEVRMAAEEEDVSINIRSSQVIPPEVRPRIFQRGFSTKEGPGRGLGTYTARLLGESLLSARVDFATSEEAGTVFRVLLPR